MESLITIFICLDIMLAIALFTVSLKKLEDRVADEIRGDED